MSDLHAKSTVDEIRARFDNDVERFSDLLVGQKAAMDAPEALDLISAGVAIGQPDATDLLDVGCGAGNWSLKLLQRLPKLRVTLVDLSVPMLDRAEQRIAAAGGAVAGRHQGDVRTLSFPSASFDLIVAGSVLHHLRDEGEWRMTFAAMRRWLRPGGSLWVYDMVDHATAVTRALATAQYAAHLDRSGGPEHREKVFAYIEKEDTPRPLIWQVDRLREAGFSTVEVLHKHGPFAAYVAMADHE